MRLYFDKALDHEGGWGAMWLTQFGVWHLVTEPLTAWVAGTFSSPTFRTERNIQNIKHTRLSSSSYISLVTLFVS